MSKAATRDTAAASAAIAEEQARRVTEIAAASDAADAAAVQERRESIAAADAAMTEEQARRVKELADGEAASAVAEAEERAEATAEAIDAAERTRAASLAADAEIDAAAEAERCVPLSLARVRTAPCSFTACAHTTPSHHTHSRCLSTDAMPRCLAPSLSLSPLHYLLSPPIITLIPTPYPFLQQLLRTGSPTLPRRTSPSKWSACDVHRSLPPPNLPPRCWARSRRRRRSEVHEKCVRLRRRSTTKVHTKSACRILCERKVERERWAERERLFRGGFTS